MGERLEALRQGKDPTGRSSPLGTALMMRKMARQRDAAQQSARKLARSELMVPRPLPEATCS